MIARNALLGIMIYTPIFSLQSPLPRSEPSKETIRMSGTTRLQVRYKNWQPNLEGNLRLENGTPGEIAQQDPTPVRSAMAQDLNPQRAWHLLTGSYYTFFSGFMVGAFYRIAQGERHRNDWASNWGSKTAGGNWDDWFWLDTRNRYEHSAIADITWRSNLKFIPGENWVFEIKNRMMHTYYNDPRYAATSNAGKYSPDTNETKYIVRPGLMYYWLKGDQPFMNFYLQYEAHFALNFGNRALTESWAYFGFLYHITDSVALGLNIARAQWWWTTSDSVTSIAPDQQCAVAPGAASVPCNQIQYTTTDRAWVFGFTALVRLDFTPDP